MALTATQKQRVRNWAEEKARNSGVPVTWVKAAINDVCDAFDTFLLDNQASINTRINNASQPHGVTFTAAQKKILFALYCLAKYEQDKDG